MRWFLWNDLLMWKPNSLEMLFFENVRDFSLNYLIVHFINCWLWVTISGVNSASRRLCRSTAVLLSFHCVWFSFTRLRSVAQYSRAIIITVILFVPALARERVFSTCTQTVRSCLNFFFESRVTTERESELFFARNTNCKRPFYTRNSRGHSCLSSVRNVWLSGSVFYSFAPWMAGKDKTTIRFAEASIPFSTR